MNELRELGHSEADLQAAFAARLAPSTAVQADVDPAADLYTVWPANEPALRIFLELETQWRFHPTSGMHVGLRIDALNQAIEDLLHEEISADAIKPADLRGQLRKMERAALDAMKELRVAELEQEG